MITEIIFLSHEYKEMIDASKISLDNVIKEKRSTIFSASDNYAIQEMSERAMCDGIVAMYGFESYPAAAIYGQESNPNIDYKTKLNAYCPNKNSIILWNSEPDESSSNNMFKANLKEILKAMTRVMSFDDVIKSTQFELFMLKP